MHRVAIAVDELPGERRLAKADVPTLAQALRFAVDDSFAPGENGRQLLDLTEHADAIGEAALPDTSLSLAERALAGEAMAERRLEAILGADRHRRLVALLAEVHPALRDAITPGGDGPDAS